MEKRLSHKEIARRGGLKTLALHGKSFYSALGKKGGETRAKKYGSDYYKRLSLAGVEGRRIKKENKTAKSLK